MSHQTDADADSTLRFEHPKIIGIDVAKSATLALKEAGYNVRGGTFGAPIAVPISRQPHALPFSATLPNVGEQEIVIADLSRPRLKDEPLSPGLASSATFWQQTRQPQIEPRLPMMQVFRPDFERIYAHGGVFVFFAAPVLAMDFIYAPDGDPGHGTHGTFSNWEMLGALEGLEVTLDEGEEINPEPGLEPSVAEALRAATFNCVIEPTAATGSRWVTLAKSKYGKAVAGILVPQGESGEGFVLVLPRIKEKGAFLRDLLDTVLPPLASKLFPEDERQAWVGDDRYASHAVAALRTEIEQVEARAGERVAELEGQIDALRAKDAHLRALLTATGAELVAAVKETLESLGFTDVGDVDAEEGVQDGRLREDLQVRTGSPVVLSEVKGINNLPRDDDALEVGKYILPRIREWDRTDVRGLTIVNHQRGLPPADRDTNVFQGDQIENAEGQGIGLLATVDLYRLARGFERNGWRHDQVASLFTDVSGRVEPLPSHYEPIGEVVNFYEMAGAVTVQLEEGIGLAVGEKVAYELPLDFAEELVTEIQVDGTEFDPAPPGAHVGLKTSLTKQEARNGTRVYRVGSWS